MTERRYKDAARHSRRSSTSTCAQQRRAASEQVTAAEIDPREEDCSTTSTITQAEFDAIKAKALAAA